MDIFGARNYRATCRGCIYHKMISEYTWGCFYCHDTGNTRDCPPDQCNKKVIGKTKRRRRRREEQEPQTH